MPSSDFPDTSSRFTSAVALTAALIISITLQHCSCCSVVQLFSPVWLFVTPWTAAHQAFLSFTISRSLHKLISIDSLMLSNYLILFHPLLLLPSIFPSIRVFSNESFLCIRWTLYRSFSFSFSISPSREYSGLISFRIDWFDLPVCDIRYLLFTSISTSPFSYCSWKKSYDQPR